MPSDEMSIGTAVEQVEGREVAPHTGMNVERLIALALEKDGAVDVIERLVELRNKEEERDAARAFHAAFAEFKARCPAIPRRKRGAGFANDAGTRSYVYYADIETIQAIVDPILLEVGLSYTWSSVATDKLVTTHCTLRHVLGHEQTSSMTLPISGPPKSSVTQASSGTRSFAKRITLSDVLGISTVDDKDGADGGQGGEEEEQPVDRDQLANLQAVWDEVAGKMRQGGRLFFNHFGVDALAKIPAARYREALDMLEQKRS